jgi:hypothetical protein
MHWHQQSSKERQRLLPGSNRGITDLQSAHVLPEETVSSGLPSEPTSRLLAGCSDQPEQPLDADLQRVLDAWPALPDHIKAAVLALIGIAR